MEYQGEATDFDRLVTELQQQIAEQERALYSAKVIEEAHNPQNLGRMARPDAYGIVHGWCGDTMVLPDHFDLVARFYDRVFHFLGPERLMSLLQARPAERILDIGGGTGRVSQTFGDDYTVVVCDPSWGMLREARQKQMIACCGLAEHLPFANDAFDRIVMVDTFHHLRDQHVAAKETLRVLRPGGRLVIEEPDIRRRAVKWTALGERLLLMRSRFHSIADLARIFEEAGGRIVAMEEGHDYNVRLAVERVEAVINGACRTNPSGTAG